MKKLGLAVAAAALLALGAGTANAQENLPSSKAVASVDNLVNLGVACAAAGPIAGDINSPDCTGVSAVDDTGWVNIHHVRIKTANNKELAFDMALQCGIVTDTTVKSKGGNKEGSNARGTIRVRIRVRDDSSGVIRFAQPTGGLDAFGVADPLIAADPVGIVYCDRFQQLEAKFAGLNCTADLITGIVTCTDPEELRLLLRTLNANAFNFLLPDVQPGAKSIWVQARAEADANIFGTDMQSNAQAQAFAGAGSLFVEEVRFIRGEDGIDIP